MLQIFNKKNIVTALWILIIIVALFLMITNPRHNKNKESVWGGYTRAALSTDNNQNIDIVIADTPEKRTQGLSDTPSLESGLGMLFVFEQSGINGFWMKDMKYAIDIFWLNDAYQVVHTQRNVTPDTYPESFGGEVISRYVLETNVGELADFTKIQLEK